MRFEPRRLVGFADGFARAFDPGRVDQWMPGYRSTITINGTLYYIDTNGIVSIAGTAALQSGYFVAPQSVTVTIYGAAPGGSGSSNAGGTNFGGAGGGSGATLVAGYSVQLLQGHFYFWQVGGYGTANGTKLIDVTAGVTILDLSPGGNGGLNSWTPAGTAGAVNACSASASCVAGSVGGLGDDTGGNLAQNGSVVGAGAGSGGGGRSFGRGGSATTGGGSGSIGNAQAGPNGSGGDKGGGAGFGAAIPNYGPAGSGGGGFGGGGVNAAARGGEGCLVFVFTSVP